MASHPHDGKIYITVLDRKREFIVLGSQSSQAILKWNEQRMVETTPSSLSGSHEAGA